MWYNSLSDEELLARTLEAEAGNQGLGGMIAVAAVIRNRTGGGQSIRDVILAPGQFSAWNSVTGYANGEQGQDMKAIRPSADARTAAKSVLSGDYVDPTGGATHYYNPELANPSWGVSGGGKWKTIGAHVFGRPAGEQNPVPTSGKNPPPLENLSSAFNHPNQVGEQTMAPRNNMGFVNSQGFIDAPYPTQRPVQSPNTPQGMQRQMSMLQKMGRGLADPRLRQLLSTFSRTQIGARLRDQATQEVGNNQTAKWLAQQEGGQPYADAIMQGALTGQQAYSQWLNEKNQGRNTKEIDGKLIDTETGEVIYEGNPEALQQLDKDQNAIINQQNTAIYKVLKPYREIFNAYGQISRAISAQRSGVPSGVNDLVISISFSKLLDPESVVRAEESEAVNAAGGGVASAFNGLMNFLDGEGSLSPAVRTTIMTTTEQTANTWYNQVVEERERALKQAELSGIPRNLAEQVLVKPKPPVIEPLPQSGDGDGNDPEQPNGPVPAWATPLTQEQWNGLTATEVADLTKQAEAEGKI